MARITPSVSQKLFIPTIPRQDYGGDLEMPGIDTTYTGFTPAYIKPKPPSLSEIIMARYDDILYPQIMQLLYDRIPAFSERDYNYNAIKNLTQSAINMAKEDYGPLVASNNWTMIYGMLTLYTVNTVINKYMRLKNNKMLENENHVGMVQYSYGDSADTGVFPVEGTLTEVPFVVDFSRKPPNFPYDFNSWDKPEQSKVANGKGL